MGRGRGRGTTQDDSVNQPKPIVRSAMKISRSSEDIIKIARFEDVESADRTSTDDREIDLDLLLRAPSKSGDSRSKSARMVAFQEQPHEQIQQDADLLPPNMERLKSLQKRIFGLRIPQIEIVRPDRDLILENDVIANDEVQHYALLTDLLIVCTIAEKGRLKFKEAIGLNNLLIKRDTPSSKDSFVLIRLDSTFMVMKTKEAQWVVKFDNHELGDRWYRSIEEHVKNLNMQKPKYAKPIVHSKSNAKTKSNVHSNAKPNANANSNANSNAPPASPKSFAQSGSPSKSNATAAPKLPKFSAFLATPKPRRNTLVDYDYV